MSFSSIKRPVEEENSKKFSAEYKRALKNDPYAQNWIRVLYHNGQGVEQDYKEPLTWYRKAADLGHELALEKVQNKQQ